MQTMDDAPRQGVAAGICDFSEAGFAGRGNGLTACKRRRQCGNEVDLSGGALAPGAYTLFTADISNAYSGLIEDPRGIILAGLSIGTGLSTYPGSALQEVGDDILLNVVPEPATDVLTVVGLVFAFTVAKLAQ
jgi:hypothetical protein